MLQYRVPCGLQCRLLLRHHSGVHKVHHWQVDPEVFNLKGGSVHNMVAPRAVYLVHVPLIALINRFLLQGLQVGRGHSQEIHA